MTSLHHSTVWFKDIYIQLKESWWVTSMMEAGAMFYNDKEKGFINKQLTWL